MWDALESSSQYLLGFKAHDAAESVTNVPLWLAQLDGNLGKAPVEKANVGDTVCQVRGRRLQSLDSRGPASQQLVALGIAGGKQVENGTWIGR